VPDAVIQYADTGIEWGDKVQSFATDDRLKQVLVYMVRVISEWASARRELLARVPVLLSMLIEEQIYIVEEKRVAVEIKDLRRRLERKVRQNQELVKSRIESQNLAPGMGFLEKRCIFSKTADLDVPTLSLGQKFIARAIKKKQPHRN
jgi:hypothetical protein